MSARNLLVIASLCLSVLIGLALRTPDVSSAKRQGGGKAGAKGSRTHIGLSLDTLKEARWASDRDAFVRRAEALGAKVTVLSANSDDTRQMADVEALITSQVDVIVIVPHDGKAMAKAVTRAHAHEIPVIAYDRVIKDSDVDLYVTFDNERVGELQARYLVDHLPPNDGPSPIVRIYGSKTDNNASLFKAGQDRVIDEAVQNGKVTVIHEDWAEEWKPENAKRIVNAALTKHGNNIHGVLASNDGTAGGAIQALKEEGLAGKVVVTGQDAERAACQRIVRGEQSCTIFKPLKQLARGAAELATKLAKGRPIIARDTVHNGHGQIPSVFYDVMVVTKDNMRETVVKEGFHSEDAIYR